MNQIASYVMNPAEDVVLYGDELTEGMLVLPGEPTHRDRGGTTEDERLRAQRFRRVTKLRPVSGATAGGAVPQMAFVAEWVDGYQEAWSGAVTKGWIVKKSSMPGYTEED